MSKYKNAMRLVVANMRDDASPAMLEAQQIVYYMLDSGEPMPDEINFDKELEKYVLDRYDNEKAGYRNLESYMNPRQVHDAALEEVKERLLDKVYGLLDREWQKREELINKAFYD